MLFSITDIWICDRERFYFLGTQSGIKNCLLLCGLKTSCDKKLRSYFCVVSCFSSFSTLSTKFGNPGSERHNLTRVDKSVVGRCVAVEPVA